MPGGRGAVRRERFERGEWTQRGLGFQWLRLDVAGQGALEDRAFHAAPVPAEGATTVDRGGTGIVRLAGTMLAPQTSQRSSVEKRYFPGRRDALRAKAAVPKRWIVLVAAPNSVVGWNLPLVDASPHENCKSLVSR